MCGGRNFELVAMNHQGDANGQTVGEGPEAEVQKAGDISKLPMIVDNYATSAI